MRTTSILSLAFGLIIFANAGMAQDITIGAKAGLNFSNVRVDGISSSILPDRDMLSGTHVGVFVEIPMQNGFSFAPEILYTQKGFRTKAMTSFEVWGMDIPVGGMANTRLNYVEIPALIKYSVGNDKASAYVTAGPSVSYLMSGHIQTKARMLIDINIARIDLDVEDDLYNRLDYGGVVGIGGGVKAGQGKLFMDVRYQHSINDVLNEPIIDTKIRNYGFSAGIGYAYQF